MYCIFFFKQKTAYDMRISDWSSDVCSSDLRRDSELGPFRRRHLLPQAIGLQTPVEHPFRLVLAGRYIAHRILAQPLGRELLPDIAGKSPFVLRCLCAGGRCFGVTPIPQSTPSVRLSTLTPASAPRIAPVTGGPNERRG